MRHKTLIKKLVAPRLQEQGFELLSYPPEYFFIREDAIERIQIFYDFSRGSPMELSISLHIKDYHCVLFRRRELKQNFVKPVEKPIVTIKGDDERFINELTDQVVSIILPYLEQVSLLEIRPTLDMYEALACNTLLRAERFAAKWGLPMHLEWAQGRVDQIIYDMQSDIEHRETDFYKHKEELLDLTAYVGEQWNLRSNVPSQWIWRENPYSKKQEFIISGQNYDVLNRVISAWKYGREADDKSLRGIL